MTVYATERPVGCPSSLAINLLGHPQSYFRLCFFVGKGQLKSSRSGEGMSMGELAASELNVEHDR